MRRYFVLLQPIAIIMMLAVAAFPTTAQTQLSSDLREKIDKIAVDALAQTGVPSASVAVVKNGQIVYLKAYGDARIEPRTSATPEMRYSIGSISKQFTATAILLLQEQGKLSLDDRVGKFIPDLTRANEVTIRQLLSHTSGYQDYWPQDYVFPLMLQPVTAQKILDMWARKPLDFDPGTKWQYSNTNYVIAGVIVEKASGMPLLQFLREKVFTPLEMKSVTNIDQEKLGETDPTGYLRYALGPLRPAPKEGKGWLFAAGELAMPAQDLAKWDISIIEGKLLKPSSYREFETEVLLKNGVGTRYGLGVDVGTEAGHRALSHGGEVSGFTAENIVFPDERVAVAVLTNQDAAGAAGRIAHSIAPLLLATDDPATPQKLEQARKIFEGLQHGTIDRSLFTDNANSYFSEQALKDFSGGLSSLGTPQEFNQVAQGLRGGMTLRVYRIKFAQKSLRAWTYEMPNGKLEQYQIAEQD
ncbi:MAG TPA: serine hydrolase domain-containing protein [Pyrinomonadaceae bacterium]|jgi:CubicO group peptidase (beta-lactamase class C family)|nr:serine hydrolase domain-containing protein [Pyrinomonadaceae bacterium]